MRKDVSIHEREEVFEVNGEDRPWVGEVQTGKGEIKKGIKRWRFRGGRVHVIDSLFQMRESAANCGGNRHVDVRCGIQQFIIIFCRNDGSRGSVQVSPKAYISPGVLLCGADRGRVWKKSGGSVGFRLNPNPNNSLGSR